MMHRVDKAMIFNTIGNIKRKSRLIGKKIKGIEDFYPFLEKEISDLINIIFHLKQKKWAKGSFKFHLLI